MPNQETERQYTERILSEMIAEANAAEEARAEEDENCQGKGRQRHSSQDRGCSGQGRQADLARAAHTESHLFAQAAVSAMPGFPTSRPPRRPRQAARSLIDGLFPVTEWPQPPKPQFPKLNRKADRRSDFVIAALGVTLGLICALFPWYIFFNQEQFGVRAIKFGGTGTNSGRAGGGVATAAQRAADGQGRSRHQHRPVRHRNGAG